MFKSLFDDGYKEFKRCWKVSKKVLALYDEMKLEEKTEADEEWFKAKTQEFKDRYQQGESLDHILPEAFAVVRRAAQNLAYSIE